MKLSALFIGSSLFLSLFIFSSLPIFDNVDHLVSDMATGWEEEITGIREWSDLPDNARRYIERVEALVGVPVQLISVGPGRDETICREELFPRS